MTTTFPSIPGPSYPINLEARDPVIRSSNDIGLAVFRRRIAQAEWEGDLKFTWEGADYADFVDWWAGDAYWGTEWFTAPWLAGLGFDHHQARARGQYAAVMLAHNPEVWEVVLPTEIRDQGDEDLLGMFHPWRDPWLEGVGGSPVKNASGTYAAAVLVDAPWGFWELDEAPGSTKALDTSGNGRDATTNYSDGVHVPCYSPLIWEAHYHRFIAKSAFDNSITVPSFNPNGSGAAASVELWGRFFKHGGSAAATHRLFYHSSGSVNRQVVVDNVTGLISFSCFNSAGTESKATSTTVVLDLDYPMHVVGTIDTSGDGKARIYINGLLEATSGTALADLRTNTNVCRICGNDTDSGAYIGQLAVFDAALTDVQISAHYAAGERPS